ncbi:MAG: tetratricopeptide repeat protein, partial [Verrucomicrobia bacterium]|nr:tetratricopeptide repeat protein [Verrucomicrobiota bacterium]
YVSTLFEDTRLKSLARIGLSPLLDKWIKEKPEAAEQLAILSQPAIWTAHDYYPLPKGDLFVGVKDADQLDPAELMKQYHQHWKTYHLPMKSRCPVLPENVGVAANKVLYRHLGKVANNIGVLMEDLERPDLAYEAYEQARRFDDENISAFLNVLSLATRENRPEAQKLQAEFEDFVKTVHTKYQVWALSYHFGYVRQPEAYSKMGWAWAMSGRPRLAIKEIKKALELGGDSESLQLALASLYFSEKRKEESEKVYLELLKENPDNGPAILGLARIAMLNGDFDGAREYHGRLRELGVSSALIALEESVLEAITGNLPAAQKILRALVKENPSHMKAWAALALIALEQGDHETVTEATEELAKARISNPSIMYAVAQMQFARGHYQNARMNLDRVIHYRPGDTSALELLLRIDSREGKMELAEQHVDQLLIIDSENAFGNYILGTLQMSRGEYHLAEDSLRVSISSAPTYAALNDLAWVLYKDHRYDEALTNVQHSLQLFAGNPSAWDTQGVVLMALNRLPEAEEAIEKSLALQPGEPNAILHMAQLLEKKGMFEKALELADPLLDRPGQFPPEEYEQAKQLVYRVRKKLR